MTSRDDSAWIAQVTNIVLPPRVSGYFLV